jgi:hypothetical protein
MTDPKAYPTTLTPEPAPVFVRVHTRVREAKPKKAKGDKEKALPPKWAHFAVVLDCETTVDLRQDLNFLWWRFCELKNGAYVCQQEGVVHADGLPAESVEIIRKFAQNKRADVEDGCPEEIRIQSRTEFVDGDFWNAIRTGAVIVCFNAPFDLSRLALEYRNAQKKNTGWSMVLWKYKGKPDKLKPKLRIKPKDSRAAFISLAGGDPYNRLEYAGRFLDLSVLGWTLRNRHMTLNGFLDSFGLEGKLEHEPTGTITPKELEYGRHDVDRTVALLNAMKQEYDGFPLDLPPEKAMSAASITKAFLDEMQITRPARKFTLSDDIYGKCMQAYFGGRSEIRIRHQEMPIVVCDTTSEYPTVAALQDLWSLLTAADIEVVDCTTEAQQALHRTTPKTVLKPSTWPELSFFASIRPAGGDVVPVRALYADTGETNIGVNPLTCSEPLWYAGPDLAASKLKTGHAPEVVEAFKLVPKGIQKGMKATAIGTRTMDPATDDFFRVVIEERKALPKSHPHYLLLKIIANALYGVFAELNRFDYGKNDAKRLDVFSGEHKFDQPTLVVERPGQWQFPPAAALITAGGRLMLAILEQMVESRGGTYLLTDTDSIFFVASEKGGLVPCPGGRDKLPDGTPAVKTIKWDQVHGICTALDRLNPYDPSKVADILKVEDCNYDGSGDQHQLYGFAISAKRYVVYKRRKSKMQIIKPSEHGLGIIYVPDERKRYKPNNCKDQDNAYPVWIVESWERLLADHFQQVKNPENVLVTGRLWFGDFPAIMRIRVTTPNVMESLRRRDPGAAKPYNFAISPILIDCAPDCALVAPSGKHAERWLTQEYIEIHSLDKVKLLSNYRGKKVVPQTVAGVLWRHFLHPEHKSLAPDGQPCGAHTRGLLLRRPIEAMTPLVFIGKEIERKAQEGEDISMIDTAGPLRYHAGRTKKTRAADPDVIRRAQRFSIRQLMRESGKHQHVVERFLRSERVHPATRACVTEAITRLERTARGRDKDRSRRPRVT